MYAVIWNTGSSAYGRSGPMNAAMNRVAHEFGTRDNIVIIYFVSMKWLRLWKIPDCLLNARYTWRHTERDGVESRLSTEESHTFKYEISGVTFVSEMQNYVINSLPDPKTRRQETYTIQNVYSL
jgi:hypothetical protein